MRDVDIVIPVYDGYEETISCLQSVLASVDLSWAQLVLVNDASPNQGITDHLRELDRQYDCVILLENEENLGFVATANRGMRYSADRDVLLLNSDVEVAGDWLRRLRDAAYHHKSVASVTPFSNNATICSFPNFCRDNPLLFGLSVEQIDAYFAENFHVDDLIRVPTGVGFCMYIGRDVLDQVVYFDLETFGRGYGEENDWCQRAQKAGWNNLQLANCFVYHKGGVSFGAEHNPRIAKAQEILDEKYPRYHSDIQEFIAADEGREIRIRAIFGLFAQQNRRKILLVTHKLGGGAQQHVDELASLYDDEALFLQITPDRDGESVTLTCFDRGTRLKDGLFFDVGSEYDKLIALLRELGVGRVHFHHVMGLHPRLWMLAGDLECDYDLTIHDYFLVNGNPTLTDDKARYVSEEEADFDERCAGHYPLPPGVTAAQWRENQTVLVDSADRVIFPSHDCYRRFLNFFETGSAVVAWHPDYLSSQPYPLPRWDTDRDKTLRVLVLGALSREKGADELETVASLLRGKGIEFHLLGYAYRALGDSVITHGPYENKNVYSLVESIDPDVVWFPALWPESYSYTLSVALHCGLPVVVPNMGAFVERVQGRAHSVVCDWDQSTEDWGVFWEQTLEHRGLPPGRILEPIDLQTIDKQFYQSRYLEPVVARQGQISAEIFNSLASNYYAHGLELSLSERILTALWKLSRTPLVARLISLIPFKLQRAIKRRFSSRPMHDIVGK